MTQDGAGAEPVETGRPSWAEGERGQGDEQEWFADDLGEVRVAESGEDVKIGLVQLQPSPGTPGETDLDRNAVKISMAGMRLSIGEAADLVNALVHAIALGDPIRT